MPECLNDRDGKIGRAVNGPGTLAVLTFTAIGSGQAPVTIEEVALKDSQSQPVAASTASLGVQIQ